MSKRRNSQGRQGVKAVPVRGGLPAGPAKRKKTFAVRPAWTYGVLFVVLAVFCTLVYGDVFARAQQESFVNGDAVSMKFLTDKPLGTLYWGMRWLLLAYKSKWLGGLLLACVLTLTAWLLDRLLRLPAAWAGVGAVVPLAELAWMVAQGTNLYYKNEPSRFVLLAVGTLLVAAVAYAVAALLRRKRTEAQPKAAARPWGLMLMLVVAGALYGYALTAQQNPILTARMQQRLWQQDWEGMIEDGLSARRPTRSVAAYFAIALLQQGELLERLYEIPYNYPVNGGLEKHDGGEEYGILQADADFEAGLVQVAYHYALEYTVMNGPTTYNMKRMALCAVMMEEKELARKYFRILKSLPFEKDFIARYEPMVDNPKLIEEDPELALVRKLKPREHKYEQQYRQPAFMGYNLGLMEGSDETLITSTAACMYSKDLLAMMPRVMAMRQKNMNLPMTVQQAICCLSLKDKGAHKDVVNILPNSQLVMSELQSFLMDAKEYMKDKEKLRTELKGRWLGTYMYYYYCENNDSIATGKKSPREAAVN
ncbi:MAG: hypothetical protein IJ659_04620 [Alloprevotella sp.]|nr:hypothetical protein [Alloprevotella sp.]